MEKDIREGGNRLIDAISTARSPLDSFPIPVGEIKGVADVFNFFLFLFFCFFCFFLFLSSFDIERFSVERENF